MTPIFGWMFLYVQKIARISVKEGRLQASGMSVQERFELMALANADAVHYSTKLEGNSMSLEQVTRVLKGKTAKVKTERDLNEVLNYAKARSVLFEEAKKQKPLTERLILDAHGLLMARLVEGKLKGHYREAQNVIQNSRTGSIVYMPPETAEVKKMMRELVRWSQKAVLEGLSPLIAAPIFHYRFVTIHPFLDGNGRCARLVTNFILQSGQFTISEFAAIEKQHERNRSDYYKQLRSLQGPTFYDIPNDIDLTGWIEYWLDCVDLAYDEALRRSEGRRVGPSENDLDARLQKALGLFKKHGRLKASDYQTLMGLGRTQAVADLNYLITRQLIERIGGGRTQSYQLIRD